MENRKNDCHKLFISETETSQSCFISGASRQKAHEVHIVIMLQMYKMKCYATGPEKIELPKIEKYVKMELVIPFYE